MKILMKANEKVLAIIGEQPVFANKDYRFMKYCMSIDVDEGKLIFNGLTRTAIIISEEELQNIHIINNNTYLYKMYFLVPEDFDEKKIVDDIRERLRIPLDDLYLNNPTRFTIFPTTKCNARCFYCYENTMQSKKHMTIETAEKVADYINTFAPDAPISLGFFGGEPLFNQKVIDIIINKLIGYGRVFNTDIISNGYLFTPELVNKAKNIWNLTSAQITIDGTENIYNKIKNYIYKDESPYKRVLNNIAILLNRNIAVTIRLNIDLYNADDLKKLIAELHSRFGNHPKFGIYMWPIFEEGDYSRTREENVQLFQKMEELEQILTEYNYNWGLLPAPDIRFVQCMADNGQAVTIGPGGDLGTCEHYGDSHFWGHIDNPFIKNYDELKIWKEYNDLEICKDCPLYPSCVLPKHCNEMGRCDDLYQAWRIRRHLFGLKYFYDSTKIQNNVTITRLPENV